METQTMPALDRLLDAVRVDANTFVFTVPDGWQQGRGAFGGLVVGAMVRAAITATNDVTRVVRSVTAELLGPVLPGVATLHVERLRQGSGVSAVRVRLLQAVVSDGPLEEQACAVVVTAKARPNTLTFAHREAPFVSVWDSNDEVPVHPPFGPVFGQHYVFRPTAGLPFSSSPRAATQGFIQARAPISAFDAAVVAAYADAWWPAVYAMIDAPRPMATITFALELVADPSTLDPTLPLLHEAKSDHAQDGYSVEHRALWTTDGRLVAENQQVFAIIR